MAKIKKIKKFSIRDIFPRTMIKQKSKVQSNKNLYKRDVNKKWRDNI